MAPLASLQAQVSVPRRRGEGWRVVIAEVDGRRVSFMPPNAPDVDPAALILMKHRA